MGQNICFKVWAIHLKPPLPFNVALNALKLQYSKWPPQNVAKNDKFSLCFVKYHLMGLMVCFKGAEFIGEVHNNILLIFTHI